LVGELEIYCSVSLLFSIPTDNYVTVSIEFEILNENNYLRAEQLYSTGDFRKFMGLKRNQRGIGGLLVVLSGW
jgi:hypothetical protein